MAQYPPGFGPPQVSPSEVSLTPKTITWKGTPIDLLSPAQFAEMQVAFQKPATFSHKPMSQLLAQSMGMAAMGKPKEAEIVRLNTPESGRMLWNRHFGYRIIPRAFRLMTKTDFTAFQAAIILLTECPARAFPEIIPAAEDPDGVLLSAWTLLAYDGDKAFPRDKIITAPDAFWHDAMDTFPFRGKFFYPGEEGNPWGCGDSLHTVVSSKHAPFARTGLESPAGAAMMDLMVASARMEIQFKDALGFEGLKEKTWMARIPALLEAHCGLPGFDGVQRGIIGPYGPGSPGHAKGWPVLPYSVGPDGKIEVPLPPPPFLPFGKRRMLGGF